MTAAAPDIRFLVDNHFPRRLAGWIAARGHDAAHVLDLDLAKTADSLIWAIAAGRREIVVSKDQDLFVLANRPNDVGRLLWVRLPNVPTPRLLARFDSAWPELLAKFEAGQRVVELR